MRNYVTCWITHWSVDSAPNLIEGWGFGDDQDTATGIANNAIAVHGSIPPVVLQPLGRFYYPLSKSIVNSLISLTQEDPQQGPYNLLVALQNAFELEPQVSPRKVGDFPYNPDGKGAPKGRKNSFSGATGLFNFVQALPIVAKALVSIRNPPGGKLYAQRIAGIVLEIYKNATTLKITVVQASNQFHDLVVANPEIFAQI